MLCPDKQLVGPPLPAVPVLIFENLERRMPEKLHWNLRPARDVQVKPLPDPNVWIGGEIRRADRRATGKLFLHSCRHSLNFVTNARWNYIPQEDEVPGSNPGGSNNRGHSSTDRARTTVSSILSSQVFRDECPGNYMYSVGRRFESRLRPVTRPE